MEEKFVTITIQISHEDFEKIKMLAEKEGVSYQKYIEAVIHKEAEKM